MLSNYIFETWHTPLVITLLCFSLVFTLFKILLNKQIGTVNSITLTSIAFIIALLISGISWGVWSILYSELQWSAASAIFLLSIFTFLISDLSYRSIRGKEENLTENEQLFIAAVNYLSIFIIISIFIAFFIFPVWVAVTSILFGLLVPNQLNKLITKLNIFLPVYLGIIFSIICIVTLGVSILIGLKLVTI